MQYDVLDKISVDSLSSQYPFNIRKQVQKREATTPSCPEKPERRSYYQTFLGGQQLWQELETQELDTGQ